MLASEPRRSKTIAYLVSRYPNPAAIYYMNEIIEVAKKMRVSVYAFDRGAAMGSAIEMPRESVYYLEDAPRQVLTIIGMHVVACLRKPAGYVSSLLLALRGRKYGMLKRFKSLPVWAQTMRREGITHIHAHYADSPTEAAQMLSRLTGIPYSFTGHAYDIYLAPRLMEEKIREAAFVITCTKYNRRYILERFWHGDPERVLCVYHGIYTDRFRRRTINKNGVFKILCVGNMVEKKGMPYLMRACACLFERTIPFELTLVGDGPLRPELESLSHELGLWDHVRFTGVLRQDDIVPLYEAANCFCLPSFQTDSGDRDGIPNVIAEAMSMELPVVSTDCSGIPELVEDGVNGYVVPQRSVQPIAEKLLTLAVDPELRSRLGKNGRQKILRVFDVREAGEKLAALFAGAS